MKSFNIVCSVLLGCLAVASAGEKPVPSSVGNRLTYLGERNPFYVDASFPRLTTPMWFGEDGIEAVVILSIDDLGTKRMDKYRDYLAPIVQRLKEVQGVGTMSIFTNDIDPDHPQVDLWLNDGVRFDVHTTTHPCPLMKENFDGAVRQVLDCIKNLAQIPRTSPVAYRMPCCDSINSATPRFFSEIFLRKTDAGKFLEVDTSVLMFPEESYREFAPFNNFATTASGYPYPYVINDLIWEFPIICPSDWQAQNRFDVFHPEMIRAIKRGLDRVIEANGVYTFCFHPHGWIKNTQVVELIDYVAQKYGNKVRFIHFHEALERMKENLLGGVPLRDEDGGDNGVRLLDLDLDGYLDVVIGNDQRRETRLWSEKKQKWETLDFPFPIVSRRARGEAVRGSVKSGVKFGVLQKNGMASALMASSEVQALAHFRSSGWVVDSSVNFSSREAGDEPILTFNGGRDRGVRLRDVDGDGLTDLILNNESQNAVFRWDLKQFVRLPYGLPRPSSIVDASGQDRGLRFVDVDTDGHDDVILSNDDEYYLYLYRDVESGWNDRVLHGPATSSAALPRIVSQGMDQGAWFTNKAMYVANEDTVDMPDLVDVRDFKFMMEHRASRPLEPEETLKHFQVKEGFRVELVAAEPHVEDPVSIEFGADGKIWVTEMGSYPRGEGDKAEGRVRILRDSDRDGRIDQSTLFASGLSYPTGALPYGDGVLVTCAPDIYYIEDSDGDDRADVKRIVFSGFGEGNQQHRVNGLHYGLDNWIYGANGDSGGDIRIAARPEAAPVSIRGRDFRFTRDLKTFEPVSGRTQFGLALDDYGNHFGASNSRHLMHAALPERYVRRNPHYPAPNPVVNIPEHGAMAKIFQTSRKLLSLNPIHVPGHFSSACGVTVYRGETFPDEYRGNTFVCEPVGNLVHRDVLTTESATFRATRGEPESEFLTSTDSWFRPVFATTGPDGELYVVDMYRYVLEHPKYIAKEIQQILDFTAGRDRGRIYRVVYESKSVEREVGLHPILAETPTDRLVRLLKHENGWWRDTAQRLLVARQDKSEVGRLRSMVGSGDDRTRIHSLWTLDGLGALDDDTLRGALDDSSPWVREHAIRLAEPRLSDKPKLRSKVLRMTSDPVFRVRFQSALTLGELSGTISAQALSHMLLVDLEDPWMRAAVLTSSRDHAAVILQELLKAQTQKTGTPGRREAVAALARVVAAGGDEEEIGRLLGQFSRTGEVEAWHRSFVAALSTSPSGSLVLRRIAGRREERELSAWVARVRAEARTVALNQDAALADRVEAVKSLGDGVIADDKLTDELLSSSQPLQLQTAVVDNLARAIPYAGGRAERILLRHWVGAGPTARAEILQALLSRPASSLLLLAAIETNQIPVQELGPEATRRLRQSGDPQLQKRAKKLLVLETSADLERIVARYVGEADPAVGDPTRGRAHFEKHCASCHRHAGLGFQVGPDLSDVRTKPPATTIEAILNPARMVPPRYTPYVVQMKSGEVRTGLIGSETATAITILRAGGIRESVLRTEIEQVTTEAGTLMPAKLYDVLSPRDVADLLSFLKQ